MSRRKIEWLRYIHFANLINAVSLNIGLYNDLFCLMINCNQAEKKIFVSVFIMTISFVLFSFYIQESYTVYT